MAYPPDSNSSPNASPTSPSKSQKRLQELSNAILVTLNPLHPALEKAALDTFLARCGDLEDGELRLLIHYAGLTLESRDRVLDGILSYRREHNKPPIANDGEKWSCNLCPVPPPPPPGQDRKPPLSVFQNVAKHLVSHHWGLRSWVCPVCPDSSYGTQDSLNRHNVKKHGGECQPNATSAPSAHQETTAPTAEPQRQPCRERPEYPPLDQHSRTMTSQPHVSSTVDQTPPPVLPQMSSNNSAGQRRIGVIQHKQPLLLPPQHQHHAQELDQCMSKPVADRNPLPYCTGEPNDPNRMYALPTNQMNMYSAPVHVPQSQHTDLSPRMDCPTPMGHVTSEVALSYQPWIRFGQHPSGPSWFSQAYDQQYSFPAPAYQVNADRTPILSNTNGHSNSSPMYASHMNVPHSHTEITHRPTTMGHDAFEVAPGYQLWVHERHPSQFTQAYDPPSSFPTPAHQVNADGTPILSNTNGHSNSSPMYVPHMNVPYTRNTTVAQHPQRGADGPPTYIYTSEVATDVRQWQHLHPPQFPQAQPHQLSSLSNLPTGSTHYGS